jgi:prepilin-type N-terminal cleavage/methylation domain-containing protein
MACPSPRDHESAGRRGFTLIELLLVLLVLSLGAATTITWYFSKAEVTLENAAVLLAQDLRAAQHRSIFLGEPTRFVFLPDGEGYVVTDEAGAIAHNPLTDEPFLRIYPDDGVFIGVTVRAARAGEDRTLEIDGRGTALEDLSVTLVQGEEERTVEFERAEGVIRIKGSSSGWLDFEL